MNNNNFNSEASYILLDDFALCNIKVDSGWVGVHPVDENKGLFYYLYSGSNHQLTSLSLEGHSTTDSAIVDAFSTGNLSQYRAYELASFGQTSNALKFDSEL